MLPSRLLRPNRALALHPLRRHRHGRIPITTPHLHRHYVKPSTDTFLHPPTADYIEHMYSAWKNDPSSVHVSWNAYFGAVEKGNVPGEMVFQPPPGLVSIKPVERNRTVGGGAGIGMGSDEGRVRELVSAYQRKGHLVARVNPLDLGDGERPVVRELEMETYGFSPEDLDRRISLGAGILPGSVSEGEMTLRDIITTCKRIYCGTTSIEYTHLNNSEEINWLRDRFSSPTPYTPDQKRVILNRLINSSTFEKFMSTKLPTAKRFGLDGVESQLPGVQAVIDTAVSAGVKNIIFACCHRGRLNVLGNACGKPWDVLLSDFQPGAKARHGIPGDVKYHLGIYGDVEAGSGSGEKVNVHMSVPPVPSHLEAQNAIAQGMARAVQDQSGSEKDTMVFNSHTDAAFAGQGVVYETLGLANLKHYSTGGTVHLIVNNQVGFTTNADQSRGTMYVSDLAKYMDAPVFHVNADDVEAVVRVCELVAEYRARFGKDCFVDLVCYRRNGHNEMDQPFFTQPVMYERIGAKVPQLGLYTQQLMDEGVVKEDEVERMQRQAWSVLSEGFEKSKEIPGHLPGEYHTEPWDGFKTPEEVAKEIFPAKSTSITTETVTAIANKLGVPEQPFTVHKSLHRILQKRQQSLLSGKDIDWATAEALAFGSLCLEGYPVRISGQDVERGTFSQRHAILHDQKTGRTHTPLDSLSPTQARFHIANSPLSEFGVMGFEYGYSVRSPKTLVMWEAQFGDFANNAQCIIDQYISSGEKKWMQRSGLVLSLPHGMDGQGPEHSSARIERFLQLCDEDGRVFPDEVKLDRQVQDANMQVVYMTAPANYFHVLRRQMVREFRKPLIIFFSKSLLRHPMVRSNIQDFTSSSFQPLLPDPSPLSPSSIKKIIYCTGQTYIPLSKYRSEHSITDTAIVRLEQLHPFPWKEVRDNLSQYPNATEVIWSQEEAMNCGAWFYTAPRFETVFNTMELHRGRRMRFVGRDPMASVAVGYAGLHVAEEERFVADAFADR